MTISTSNRFRENTAAIIRFVDFENLGTIQSVLDVHNFRTSYYEAGIDDLSRISKTKPQVLIVLGGPIGAYEMDKYPYLSDIIDLLKERIRTKAPVLGVCLGAQLISLAMGAEVYPGSQKEIGWAPLMLSGEGRRSPLRHIDGLPVLHWHGDVFTVPEGARLLASTSINPNQAYQYDDHVLALQFHAELNPRNFERWLIGHACEIGATPGIDVRGLREDTMFNGTALEVASRRMFGEWLDNIVNTPQAASSRKISAGEKDSFYAKCAMDFVSFLEAERADFSSCDLLHGPSAFVFRRHPELHEYFSSQGHYARILTERMSEEQRHRVHELVREVANFNSNFKVDCDGPRGVIPVSIGEFIACFEKHQQSGQNNYSAFITTFTELGVYPTTRASRLVTALGPYYNSAFRKLR